MNAGGRYYIVDGERLTEQQYKAKQSSKKAPEPEVSGKAQTETKKRGNKA